MVVISLSVIIAAIQQAVQLGIAIGGIMYLIINLNRVIEWILVSYYWLLTVEYKTYQFDRSNKHREMMIFRYINKAGKRYDNYKVYKDNEHEKYYYTPGMYEIYEAKFKTTVYIKVEFVTISYKIDIKKFNLTKVENFMDIICSMVMTNSYCMATLKYGEWEYDIVKENDKENTQDTRWPPQLKVIDKIENFYNSNLNNTGLLLYGPTKTGKSSVARYAARKLQKNYYRLDLNKFNYNIINSNLISKISENSIVFIDEYDKFDGDSLQAINADLHRWLQSHDILKRKIVFILTSNKDIEDDDNSVLLQGRIEKIKFETI